MDVARQRRLRWLFHRAREIPAEERETFVTDQCGQDRELCAEVMRCLERASDDSNGSLEVPVFGNDFVLPVPLANENVQAALVGKKFGSYFVRGLLGFGGAGAVFEAEQESPVRAVALKVLRGQFASRDLMTRFQHEVQILRQLRHGGIVQVYDSGEFPEPGSGIAVPYYAMELVVGAKTIVDYAGDSRMSPIERLRLFAGVCDAVFHANQHGVIHRDLKPRNVLVDAKGQVKVIDFGIARVLGGDLSVSSLCTGTGMILGSFAYMSPEQLEPSDAGVDVRTDVYALGVILYELLCGTTPREFPTGSTILQAARIVSEQPVRKPSSVVAGLRGDIETVLLKAMDPSPSRRYQTVAELASDVRLLAEGRRVSARPPGRLTRVAAFAQRHVLVTTTAAAISIGILVLGLSVLAVAWINLKPSRVVATAAPPYELRLLSASGRILRAWPYTGKPADGRGVMLPAEGKLVTFTRLNIPSDPGVKDVDGNTSEVCVWSLGDLSKPLWTTADGVEPLKVPDRSDKEWHVPHGGFNVGDFVVADVFPANAGPEIAALHTCEFHPSVLRVYDLSSGRVLYEAWNPGSTGHLLWLSDAKLFVFLAMWGEERLSQLGDKAGASNAYWPQAIAAVRPIMDCRGGWIAGPAIDRSVAAEWYRFIAPPERVADTDAMVLTLNQDQSRFGDTLRLQVRPKGIDGNMSLEVDATGSVIQQNFSDGFVDAVGAARENWIWLSESPR